MERTLISFNVPNLITIPLMAFLGFLAAAIIWQVGSKLVNGDGQQAASSAGY